jgi:hypothetical protein
VIAGVFFVLRNNLLDGEIQVGRRRQPQVRGECREGKQERYQERNRCAKEALESRSTIPLLSQEGWREAPGWFQRERPADLRLRNHPSRDLDFVSIVLPS